MQHLWNWLQSAMIWASMSCWEGRFTMSARTSTCEHAMCSCFRVPGSEHQWAVGEEGSQCQQEQVLVNMQCVLASECHDLSINELLGRKVHNVSKNKYLWTCNVFLLQSARIWASMSCWGGRFTMWARTSTCEHAMCSCFRVPGCEHQWAVGKEGSQCE